MHKQTASDKSSSSKSSRTHHTHPAHNVPVTLPPPPPLPPAMHHHVPWRATTSSGTPHQVSFGSSEAIEVHSPRGPCKPSSAPFAHNVPASGPALDGSSSSPVDVAQSPASVVPIISTSSSRVLSTISEKNSTEDEACLASVPDAAVPGASGTSSSCSVPDYLYHKFNLSKNGGGDGSSPLAVDNMNHSDYHHQHAHLMATMTSDQTIPIQSMMVKESCDTSTATTTSESYQVHDLPPLPAKLATLNKPSSQALTLTALRSRKARHSIDVRALPSYIAKKRHSTFGQFLSGMYHDLVPV